MSGIPLSHTKMGLANWLLVVVLCQVVVILVVVSWGREEADTERHVPGRPGGAVWEDLENSCQQGTSL